MHFNVKVSCKVLDDRIKHILYTPPSAEPYYQPTGKEVTPKPVGEECGEVVYQYYPVSAVNYVKSFFTKTIHVVSKQFIFF